MSFEVNLTYGQSATLRHFLTPITRSPQPAPDAAPPAEKHPVTFFLIPGCYMGNVPPKDANLPATCDIARALSFQYIVPSCGGDVRLAYQAPTRCRSPRRWVVRKVTQYAPGKNYPSVQEPQDRANLRAKRDVGGTDTIGAAVAPHESI